MIANIDNIIDMDIAHPIIKRAARRLKKEQYFLPSSFFKKLTRHDSEVLGEMASILTDKGVPEEKKRLEYQNIILLTFVLTIAEGIYLDDSDIINAVNITAVMCIANNMHNKGLAKCYYENLTYGPEGSDNIIMERTCD